jgi:hypothetical protein
MEDAFGSALLSEENPEPRTLEKSRLGSESERRAGPKPAIAFGGVALELEINELV